MTSFDQAPCSVDDVLHANQAPLPVIWRHSRSSAFPRALDAVTECSQSTHPTHRWMRKPGSPFEEHFGQQAPAAQLIGAQAPAGELIGHRSPARSRAAFAPRPSGRSCWPLTASAPARQISSVKRTQSTRRDKDGTLFLRACRVSPIVHARSAQVGIGERDSRRAWGQQLVVRGQLHSPMGKLVMRVAHVAPIRARCFNSKRTSFHVALELEHVESVDLRSAIRKADAVLPAFAREGQRGHTV